MRSLRTGLMVGIVAFGLVVALRMSLQAQERLPAPAAEPAPLAKASETARGGPMSVQDALERPFTFPFRRPTPLEDVCRYLRETLHAPVVLDRAALARQELRADDDVQLELEGVRLKTGLKLLLDQLDLSYRVVPEDNLLIVTDEIGSADTFELVLAELKALHRDVHNLQDAVDDLRADIRGDEAGPRLHKPTIIEETPAKPGENPEEKPPSATPSSRPRPQALSGSDRGPAGSPAKPAVPGPRPQPGVQRARASRRV